MMIAKVRMTALVCVMVLSVGGIASATPVIKNFSSKGGRTSNKTNARDRMYLVKPGDKITFTVKADGAEKYEWQVNKKVQDKATGASFAWTVPDEKDIWEIRLKVSGKDSAVYQEWAVSTQSKGEAPDFFEYFTDGKWKDRTETDPWGRKLPEWFKNDKRSRMISMVDTSRYVLRMNGRVHNSNVLLAQHGVTHGTWKFKFRVTPQRSDGQKPTKHSTCGIAFAPLAHRRYRRRPRACIVMMAEYQGHNWTHIPFKGLTGIHGIGTANVPVVGAWGSTDYETFKDDKWKGMKVIRTPDKFFRWWKGTGREEHNGFFIDNLMDGSPLRAGDPDALAESTWVGVMAGSNATKSIGEIDCIEIYKDKFISPAKASYGRYVNRYGAYEAKGKSEYREGITVDGLGVRLADIAKGIGDKAIFRYDPKTGTADCYSDIHISAGSEFVLKNETLRIHCTKPGQYQIRLRNGSTIKLENSTITSAGEAHYGWLFPSEYATNSEYGQEYSSCFTGRFIARNSTINNCAGLYFAGANTVVLENTKLTNLVKSDYTAPPPFDGGPIGNWRKESGPNHALSFRGHQVCSRLLIRGCEISGKKGKKITTRFLSMDPVVENTTIYDSVLTNTDLLVKSAYVYYWGYKHSTTLSLVNTRFGRVLFPTGKASILPKYYLDVRVVDGRGRPVPGATITVVNEADNGPSPENALESFIWAAEKGYKHGGGKIPGKDLVGRRKPKYGQSMPATTTGKDGHTPLPKDVNNTMILTDYVRDKASKKEFTYTITIEKDGKKKVITGINPGPKWYRPNPNKPTHTITAVLGAGENGK